MAWSPLNTWYLSIKWSADFIEHSWKGLAQIQIPRTSCHWMLNVRIGSILIVNVEHSLETLQAELSRSAAFPLGHGVDLIPSCLLLRLQMWIWNTDWACKIWSQAMTCMKAISHSSPLHIAFGIYFPQICQKSCSAQHICLEIWRRSNLLLNSNSRKEEDIGLNCVEAL